MLYNHIKAIDKRKISGYFKHMSQQQKKFLKKLKNMLTNKNIWI